MLGGYIEATDTFVELSRKVALRGQSGLITGISYRYQNLIQDCFKSFFTGLELILRLFTGLNTIEHVKKIWNFLENFWKVDWRVQFSEKVQIWSRTDFKAFFTGVNTIEHAWRLSRSHRYICAIS